MATSKTRPSWKPTQCTDNQTASTASKRKDNTATRQAKKRNTNLEEEQTQTASTSASKHNTSIPASTISTRHAHENIKTHSKTAKHNQPANNCPSKLNDNTNVIETPTSPHGDRNDFVETSTHIFNSPETLQNKKRSRNKEKYKAYKKRKKTSPNTQTTTQQTRDTSLEDIINKFHTSMAVGPIHVCTSCHQTWFQHSVSDVSKITSISDELRELCFTAHKSANNTEWLCNTCYNHLKKKKVLPLCYINGLMFPPKPTALQITELEERLVALHIPFMSLYELPRGRQLKLKGSIVNVPVDIAPTIHSLPTPLNESHTVSIKLKKKLCYKSHVLHQSVRPHAVINALQYLMTRPLYQSSNINIDTTWLDDHISQSQPSSHHINDNNQ